MCPGGGPRWIAPGFCPPLLAACALLLGCVGQEPQPTFPSASTDDDRADLPAHAGEKTLVVANLTSASTAWRCPLAGDLQPGGSVRALLGAAPEVDGVELSYASLEAYGVRVVALEPPPQAAAPGLP